MSETSVVSIKGTARTCGAVLAVIACTTAMMISVSFTHLTWPMKVSLILGVAVVNAFLVASSLMHFLTEKKMVYIVFAFTIFFFAGLMGLTMWAMQDFPVGTSN